MAQTRGTFSQLADNTDRLIYVMLANQLKEMKTKWREVFDVQTSKRQTEISLGVTGFSDIPEKPEGAPYTTQILRPGHEKQVSHTEFGSAFDVTQTALEDDLYKQLNKHAMWFMFACRYVQETRAANVWLNNAFTTERTSDNVAAFSTAHVLAGGGTAQNRPTTDAAFSWNALRDLIVLLSTQTKHDSGQLAMAMEDMILFGPPQLEMLFDRVVNSTGLPGSADNDRNSIKATRNISISVNPLFTSTTAWGLISKNKNLHGLKAYERIPITIEETRIDPNTGNRRTPVRFRYSWFWETWQHSIATSGA
jgi:hypothetical protein